MKRFTEKIKDFAEQVQEENKQNKNGKSQNRSGYGSNSYSTSNPEQVLGTMWSYFIAFWMGIFISLFAILALLPHPKTFFLFNYDGSGCKNFRRYCFQPKKFIS